MNGQNDYIDLTAQDCDLTRYKIEAFGRNCAIYDNETTDENSDIFLSGGYKGFLLARSKQGKALTLCDVNFNYSTTDKKYATRLTFRRTDEKLQDKRVNSGQQFQRIAFHSGQDGYREFWKMIAFLEKFKEIIDVGEFSGKFKVVSKDDVVTSIKNKDQKQRLDYLLYVAEKSDLDKNDFENAIIYRQRSQSLEVFGLLLKDDNGYREKYREHHKIKKQGDEAIWHHFFKSHKWIFGLSLNLRFINDFLDEQHIGNPNTENRGNPATDLLGVNDFTTLIELKTSETKFFTDTKSGTARTNTWSFTSEFIDGVSQCLAQKDSWLKSISSKEIIDNNGQIVDKRIIRTIDPRAVFIIGNKGQELSIDNTSTENAIKRDTLERFIRDSKNVSIISFDELFERAKQIVNLSSDH